jgi:hypothetical protein
VRDLDAVAGCAADHGLELVEVVPMPANNLSVVLRGVSSQQQSSWRDVYSARIERRRAKSVRQLFPARFSRQRSSN